MMMFLICVNIFITMLMQYATVILGDQCPCIKENINWRIISAYFGVSVLFLIFILISFYGLNIGLKFYGVMAIYTLITIAFVISGFSFLTKPSACNSCDDKNFRKMLYFVTSLRAIMVLISVICTIIWYDDFKKLI